MTNDHNETDLNSKKKKRSDHLLQNSVDYGLEYGLEDGMEVFLSNGLKAGTKAGLASFAVNAVEEGIEDLLANELPSEKTSDSSKKDVGENLTSQEADFSKNLMIEKKNALSEKANRENIGEPPTVFDEKNRETPSNDSEFDEKNRQWRRVFKRSLIFLVKWAIVFCVLFWIAGRLMSDASEIRQYHWTIDVSWAIMSCGVYLLAFLPAAIFWYLSLRWMGQSPALFQAIRAFYFSQLGKYLPGKAMVVVIRSAVVRSDKVNTSVAAICVFYETLTMMMTGAFLSSMIVLIFFREHWYYSLLALGTMLVSGLPTLPPIFLRIIRILRLSKKDAELEKNIKNLSWHGLVVGMGLMTVLWILFGVSLWAAILSLGITPGDFLDNMPRYISATALAIVLGFAVPIMPGGIGIRETVLSILLIPYFHMILMLPENHVFQIQPETLAVIVSLEQRILTMIAELTLAAIFFLLPVFHWLGRVPGRLRKSRSS